MYKKHFNYQMKKVLLFISAATIVLTTATSCKNGGLSGNAEMKTITDSVSYAIGSNIADEMKQNETTLNPELIFQGYKDASEGKPLFTEADVQKVMTAFSKVMREKQMEQMQKKGDAAVEKGLAYLAAKEKEAGVKKTASGLLYRVITEGKGKTPKASNVVKVHYEGKLVGGKVFDSSYERGQPVEFEVNGVIPGWTEGLQLMKEGGKYELFIPSGLAYGPRGAGQDIGPNEALTFTVELIQVVK